MSRVFANVPGRVIPKTQKMVLDAALLNTQHYKVDQSRKRSSALSTPRCSSYSFPILKYSIRRRNVYNQQSKTTGLRKGAGLARSERIKVGVLESLKNSYQLSYNRKFLCSSCTFVGFFFSIVTIFASLHN